MILNKLNVSRDFVEQIDDLDKHIVSEKIIDKKQIINDSTILNTLISNLNDNIARQNKIIEILIELRKFDVGGG